MRWTAVLAGWLAAAMLAAAAPTSAPVLPELERDWFAASLEIGYSGFAFPINDPALARSFAQDSGLAWQIAFDHSTLPVRLDITHRRGAAFRGRVEVTTAHGYPAEEDPLGRLTTTSREFLVPPSVPTSIMLAPRVCPPSRPGAPVWLTVRLYQQGIQQPVFTQQAEAIQLEPAHLYTLHLDAPIDAIESQVINAGNHLRIEPPMSGDPPLPLFTPELFTTRHYILPVDHRQVTGLPLAAGQFAFVMADHAAVCTWNGEEQLALAQYLLGGGHLCLYNAAGHWEGLDLAAGAQSVGRGSLLPVAGGSEAAQAAIAGWLEGELAELALWLNGRCQGEELELLEPMPKVVRADTLREVYGPAQREGDVLARRPGFLHPLLLYREACRAGALEPWDYPEFLSPSVETILSNANLSSLPRLRDSETYPNVAAFAAVVRPVQGRLLLIAGLVLLPAILAGPRLRRQWLWLLAGLVGIAGAGWLWFTQQPIQEQPVRIAVYDAALALPGAGACRELQAVQTGPAGRCAFDLEADAQIRHLAWQPPGSWSWIVGLDDALWQGSGGGPFAALSTATPAPPPALPVGITTDYPAPGRVRVVVDTSALAVGERCFLQTPLGWQIIPGGQAGVSCEIQFPPITAIPGSRRLRAIQEFIQTRATATSWPGIVERSNDLALAEVIQPPRGGEMQLEQLALGGLLQQPTGFRGIDWRQGVLVAPLPSADPQREVSFIRYCFPLEVR